jgi:hypothetical protein
MNRRGFLSLFSAVPAALIPIEVKPAPIPEPELLVACNGPTCRGPGCYSPNNTAYAVPRSHCACEMMRERNAAYHVAVRYDGINWRT